MSADFKVVSDEAVRAIAIKLSAEDELRRSRFGRGNPDIPW